MSSGKAVIIILKAGLIKRILLYKISYFPEPYTISKNKIKAKIDFSVMQQNVILKMQHVSMHQILLKRLI